MRWFGNLSIFKKLMLAFLLSGTFTAALGALALVRLHSLDAVVNDMNQNWMPGMRIMLDMKATLAEYRIAEIQLVNRSDDSVLPDYQKRITEFRDHIRKDLDDYKPLIGAGDEQKLADAVNASIADYMKISDSIIAASVAHNTADASTRLNGDSKKLRRLAADAIDAAARFNVTHSFEVGQQVTHDYRNARLTLIIGTLLTVGIGLALGTLIARGVQKPLKIAADTADAISQGILDRHIEAKTTDEAGRLLASMKMMQTRLQFFIAGLGAMAERHQAGEVSHRVPTDQLAGAYARMADQVNALVASHIAVSARVVEVVQHYAEGDFAADMDRLPGEQARITDSIDAVRASFVNVNAEILKLVNAAANGNFAARGDVSRYSHDFARMVEGLNQLMEISDRGLRALTAVLAGIAAGDLTLQMEGEFTGAFADLQQNANKTIDQLRSIVSEIKSTTESINSAAVQINAGNADLSSRTEAQAASLEEAASSMEELTSTVRQNADSARQGNQLAIGASDVATKGGKAVSEVVDTMQSINQSSRKIVEIISVIDGIAFQTNILALNASVEAARAGEQGRGFAVVAGEVRTLAQRSAAAAREIKALITDSVGQIESGTRLVEVAGSTMEEIQTSVKRVTDLMAEISAASAEQTAGIEQVNTTVTQMDNATQQNAALVEESTAATESMAEQAQKLSQSVAVFRLEKQPALRAVKPATERATARPARVAGF